MKYLYLFILIIATLLCKGQTVEELESKLQTAGSAEKAAILNKLSYITRKTNPSKSVEYAKKAIDAAKSNGNKTDEMSAYLYGGYAYFYSGTYDKAADFFEKSLKLSEETGNTSGLFSINSNLATCYLRSNRCDEAERLYLKLINTPEAANNKNTQADFYQKLGLAYSCKKNYKKSLEWLNKALAIFEGNGNAEGKAVLLDDIGCVYQNYGNYNEALNYLNKALETAQKNNLGHLIKKINSDLDAIKKNKDVLSNAITEHAKEEMKMKDEKLAMSQQEIDNSKALIQEKESEIIEGKQQIDVLGQTIATTKLELEQEKKLKEQADSLKHQTDLALGRQKEINSLQNKQLFGAIIFIGFVLLLSVLLMVQFRLKKKAFDKLYIQNEEIKKQKAQIEEQAAELAKLSIVASKTDNAVMIMDAAGNFEWINEGFTRIFGLTIEDMRNQKNDNIQNFSSQPDIKNIFDTCKKEKKTVVYETFSKTGFGYNLWVQTSLTPVLNDSGEIVKIVAIDSDITKIKNAEIEIRSKNTELEEKNMLITDSISYAQTIQEAILPTRKYIDKHFAEYFIYYKPRDIVSGDFYWFGEVDSKIIIATVDCTGHGVPGGFMSMIGNTLLNEIISEKKITRPSEILNELNNKVITVLHKESDIITHQEDGMDISVCCIDKAKNEIEFSLANHTAYIFTDGNKETIEGDIYSIGEILTRRFAHKYTNHVLNYKQGAKLFMFSDGYKDQYGGPDLRKFSSDRFMNLLEECSKSSLTAVPEMLETTLKNWKKEESQIDDILVIGLKL